MHSRHLAAAKPQQADDPPPSTPDVTDRPNPSLLAIRITPRAPRIWIPRLIIYSIVAEQPGLTLPAAFIATAANVIKCSYPNRPLKPGLRL